MGFGERLADVARELQRRHKTETGKRLSQNALARRAGIDSGHLSILMRNERPNVGIETVAQIADAWGAAVDYLVRGRGPMLDPPTVGWAHPELGLVVERNSRRWHQRTVEFARALDAWWPAPRGVDEWTETLMEFQLALGEPPLPSLSSASGSSKRP